MSNSISQDQKTLLQIHGAYRVVLTLLLITSYIATYDSPIVGGRYPYLFTGISIVYGFFGVLCFAIISLSKAMGPKHFVPAQFLIDTFAIAGFAHCSGVLDSGLALLLLVTVAAANMLMIQRWGYLIAAIASLSVLSSVLWSIAEGSSRSETLMPAGLLGLACFVTAGIVQTLSARILSTQQLADARKTDIENLQRVNERIVQKMTVGVIVLNTGGMISMMNRAACHLLHIPPEKSLDLPIRLPESLHPVIDAKHGASRIIRDHHSGGDLSVTVLNLSPEGLGERLIFIEDFSAQTEQAQQLKLASLGQFTASIAHEIRNPLHAINHAAQLIRESESLDSADERLAQIIVKHCRRVNDIIENVLQLSRRAPTQAKQLLLSNWLLRLREELSAALPESIQLQFDIQASDAIVQADEGQLRQVLENLVDNASHFAGANGSEAQITIRLQRHSLNGTIILDVEDNGPGVDENTRQRLFEPFYTTREDGNGLGLYLCRELCESNYIKLSYQSGTSGGSIFRLQFSTEDLNGAVA